MKKIILAFLLLAFIASASYSYYQKNTPEYFERVVDVELMRGGKEVTPTLQEYLDDEKIAKNCSTLKQAVDKNNLGLVQYIADSELDVNCKVSKQALPVCMSTLKEKSVPPINLISYMASVGCDYHYENDQGENAFHLLYHFGSLQPNSYLKSGALELYIARLLSFGVDINHANSNGETPLMYAILKSGDLKHIKAFIKNGADLNPKTIAGNTALGLAIKNDMPDAIDLLRSEGAKGYINGNVVDEAFLLALENKREQNILEKRQKRQALWSRNISYWKDFINAHNLDLSCTFRLKGGQTDGPGGIFFNEQMNNTLSMSKGIDAFVFGGCPDWKYYHYLVIGRSGRVKSQGTNLFWHDPNTAIGSENSSFIALPFDEDFQGEIHWYGSDTKVKRLQSEKENLAFLQKYSLHVYE
ncbi:hypothetical protein GCM10009111_01010 [Colwellia asteriadis]|uniref:Ankyrin repeat domain-containing protein n=1 Tax=Colwellia asteriadis TaxID=517723 RepID=A0ABP3WH32_9GAMM